MAPVQRNWRVVRLVGCPASEAGGWGNRRNRGDWGSVRVGRLSRWKAPRFRGGQDAGSGKCCWPASCRTNGSFGRGNSLGSAVHGCDRDFVEPHPPLLCRKDRPPLLSPGSCPGLYCGPSALPVTSGRCDECLLACDFCLLAKVPAFLINTKS